MEFTFVEIWAIGTVCVIILSFLFHSLFYLRAIHKVKGILVKGDPTECLIRICQHLRLTEKGLASRYLYLGIQTMAEWKVNGKPAFFKFIFLFCLIPIACGFVIAIIGWLFKVLLLSVAFVVFGAALVAAVGDGDLGSDGNWDSDSKSSSASMNRARLGIALRNYDADYSKFSK